MQLTTHSSKLEEGLVGLHSNSLSSKAWFYDSIIAILENPNISHYKKSDSIADIFVSLDSKVEYIKEQQKLLANLKKQLELAGSNGKELVAKAIASFGISKIEGLAYSSITVSEATEKSSSKLLVLNEKALLNAGFFTVVLDTDAVEKALLSADQRHEVEEYADIEINTVCKPSSIRINKRKALSSEPIQIQKAA